MASRDIYKQTGVPYRRGYLFYGKPGTGKSSFIFALAGYLGLPICILDLSKGGGAEERGGGGGGISDNQLQKMFNSAPERSIVLIEEIDTLFIKPDPNAKKNKKDASKNADKDADKDADKNFNEGDCVNIGKDSSSKHKGKNVVFKNFTKKGDKAHLNDTNGEAIVPHVLVKHLTLVTSGEEGEKEKEKEKDENEYIPSDPTHPLPSPTCNCTFQGLLQALDGVTAQEGRLMFFTTNHVDQLAEALTRAGRMDCKIELKRGDALQIRKQFEWLFSKRFDKSLEELEDVANKIENFLTIKANDGVELPTLATTQNYFMKMFEQPDPVPASFENLDDVFSVEKGGIKISGTGLSGTKLLRLTSESSELIR